jgi:hypothetical protein
MAPPVMHDQRDDWDQLCFLLPSDLHLSAAIEEISTYCNHPEPIKGSLTVPPYCPIEITFSA